MVNRLRCEQDCTTQSKQDTCKGLLSELNSPQIEGILGWPSPNNPTAAGSDMPRQIGSLFRVGVVGVKIFPAVESC